ncbi:hypothetical protein KA107_02250 [Candidatus Pacearchaeota archaeon]|nr:hypothetical protein [Candidatus Pacearchaeota archaeon]
MNEQQLMETIKEVAAREKTTVELVMQRIQRRNEIIAKTPRFGRLAYLENLVKTGEIGADFMETALRINPIFPSETRQHFNSIREEMMSLFNVEIPIYSLKFKKTLGTFEKASGETDCNGTIWLPYKAGQILPISISHEYGHAYHAENSILYKVLRGLEEKKDMGEVVRIKAGAQKLIEGWATFVSLVYARERDRYLGKNIYEKKVRAAQSWGKFLDKINAGETSLASYYEGLKIYERLFTNRGIKGALHAVHNFTSDKELTDYSKS